MNIERINQTIERKRDQISPDITLVSPEDGVAIETQAQWMIQLLSAMYVNHGITKNPQAVIDDMVSGRMRSWFATERGVPIGVAALIDQSDGSQELGRAVALQMSRGVGGLLMLMSALDHVCLLPDKPLVAEVRTAGGFGGIPSSGPTQTISFGHLGLHAHALVPAFHHGNPDRNEQFAFSTSQTIPDLRISVS